MSARATFRLIAVCATAAALSCADSATDPELSRGATRYPPVPGLIVSAVQAGAASAFGASGGAAVVSWISLPPGSLPNAVSVRIHLEHSAEASVTTPVVDGGFDPVAIAAVAGDEVVLEVTTSDDHLVFFSARVPVARPPVVVRTDPPSGRTDVALSVKPAVIFSEPIDASSLGGSDVVLLVDGQNVPGSLRVPAAKPWLVEFEPVGLLEPSTTYTLAVRQNVRDLQGDRIESVYEAQFTTRTGPTDLPIAFVSNRTGVPYIYLTNAKGTVIQRLTRGENPSWSGDGSKLTFGRYDAANSFSGIYTINADGTNERLIAKGGFAAWSPDGGLIAYMDGWKGAVGGGLKVMNPDGTGSHLVLPHDFADTGTDDYNDGLIQNPNWSPDGRHIAFERASYGEPWLSWVVEANGSRPYLLSQDGWRNKEPSWSPDGLRIAAVRIVPRPGNLGFSNAIVDYDADGSGVYRVHALPIFPFFPWGYVGHPAWSADGHEIAFEQFVAQPIGGLLESNMRIFTVDVATGAVRQLIPDAVSPAFADYADYDVAWARS